MGRAQPPLREHVSGRRLRQRDGDRGVLERTIPGLWVRHAPMLPSDWLGHKRGVALNVAVLLLSSRAGVVNIYSQEACLSSANPKPLKSVMNLLTSVTSLTFNPSSEILAVASRVEDEAVRLVSVTALMMMSLVLVLTRPSSRCTCPASPSSPTFPSRRRRWFTGPAAWTSPRTAASSHWLTTKATPLCTGEGPLLPDWLPSLPASPGCLFLRLLHFKDF